MAKCIMYFFSFFTSYYRHMNPFFIISFGFITFQPQFILFTHVFTLYLTFRLKTITNFSFCLSLPNKNKNLYSFSFFFFFQQKYIENTFRFIYEVWLRLEKTKITIYDIFLTKKKKNFKDHSYNGSIKRYH